MPRKSKQRRGVLLLVVLSLLVVFILTALTFVVVANHQQVAAKTASRAAQSRRMDPEELLDKAAYQVLRGTTNPRSVLRQQSLLDDLYGNDGFSGWIWWSPPPDRIGYDFNGPTGTTFPDNTRGQFIDLFIRDNEVDVSSGKILTPWLKSTDGAGHTLSRTSHYYNGCVLTILTGTAGGISGRIVGYEHNVALPGPRFRVMFPRSVSPGEILHPQHQGPTSPNNLRLNARFLVNGRPFNGTGVGYNPLSGKLDAKDVVQNWPGLPQFEPEFALLTNPVYFDTPFDYVAPQGAQLLLDQIGSDRPDYIVSNSNQLGGIGGADESYDAPDYQNMFLAFVPENPSEIDARRAVIPSFHRPALIHHWMNRRVQDAIGNDYPIWFGDPNLPNPKLVNRLQRKVVLRPIPGDHPNFPALLDDLLMDRTDTPGGPWEVDNNPDQSTPGYGFRDRLIHGPWDVDNDGDGVRDSIWLDLGYPVMRAADGRLYKPMFAILCVDMDGKFNLNAHGKPDDVEQAPNPVPLANGTTEQRNPGQGYGPPEISLSTLFDNVYVNEMTALLHGRKIQLPNGRIILYPGRYGVDNPISLDLPQLPLQAPGTLGFDRHAQIKFFEHPNNYYEPLLPRALGTLPDLRAFGTPPDLRGRNRFGLDSRGVPVYEGFDEQLPTANTAYELDLSRDAPGGTIKLFDAGAINAGPDGSLVATSKEGGPSYDAPFSVAELERILRSYDHDAALLPDRLWHLVDSFRMGSRPAANRRIVTIESRDLPVPSIVPTNELQQPFMNDAFHFPKKRPLNIMDLLRAKAKFFKLDKQILARLKLTPPLDRSQQELFEKEVAREMGILLSPDLLMGLRMDVNRPFGNAQDDNQNGVVDEPGEKRQVQQPGDDDIEQLTYPVYGLINFDANNDGRFDASDTLARQEFARHLYVLMMLLTDATYVHPVVPNPGNQPNERRLSKTASVEDRERTARRIAQWAINVVDFRDSDAIMTPFEFDLYPFDGWDVDGWIGKNPVDDGLPDDTKPYRGLVWGCEYPDLVLTETLALHDRHVEDTPTGMKRDEDDDPFNPDDDDDDLDQARIPRGGAWFELYCTGNGNNVLLPRELYTEDGRLGLGFKLPQSLGPVWRLAISSSQLNEGNQLRGGKGNAIQRGVLQRFTTHPEKTQLGPENFRIDKERFRKDPLADPELPPIEIDRIVWFTPSHVLRKDSTLARLKGDPRYKNYMDRIYYNRDTSTEPLLTPGAYAVVGPRENHRIGWNKNSDRESQQNIRIFNNPRSSRGDRTVLITNNDGTDNYPAGTTIKKVLGIIAAARVPDSWTDPDLKARGLGISVSEPLRSPRYYPEPDKRTTNAIDAVKDAYNTPKDRPSDSQARRPLAEDNLLATGTTLNYRTVFVQRLANPLLVWNPLPGRSHHNPNEPVNPYITIDWMPIDLSVFNSQDRQPKYLNRDWNSGRFGQPWDLDDPNSDKRSTIDIPRRLRFASRQRGRPGPQNTGWNLWSTLQRRANGPLELASENPQDTQPVGSSDFVVRHRLKHTLGYLNKHFAPALTSNRNNVGDPSNPFPWLTWNNRPYVSQFELMLVPSSSPGRLLSEFTLASSSANPQRERYQKPHGSFGHLLNFFDSSNELGQSANFHRLFDYTHVPSRFVGTERILNPIHFQSVTSGSPPRFGTEMFHPPFNKVSNYRDPGRINVNTILSPRVWAGGILRRRVAPDGKKMSHVGPSWDRLVDSRRGYGSQGDDFSDNVSDVLSLDTSSPPAPTYFANPIRSANAGSLVPLPSLERPDIECTLLRSNEITKTDAPTKESLFRATSTKKYEDVNRNPYFRYEGLQRMGNLLTTRSNVYAVWITVGFFEVQPVNPQYKQRFSREEFNHIYPDGYWLSQELGSDIGDVKRHRAFYMMDRSIPVAFEPGQNHNVDQAILLRRFIE